MIIDYNDRDMFLFLHESAFIWNTSSLQRIFFLFFFWFFQDLNVGGTFGKRKARRWYIRVRTIITGVLLYGRVACWGTFIISVVFYLDSSVYSAFICPQLKVTQRNTLDASELRNFCFQCHRTMQSIMIRYQIHRMRLKIRCKFV